ncbi:MAG: carboxypeptidase-like regulatory domain-containing protein [Acidobacteriota bacterium]|nr:carboxypeptidase-like regulatory domain-containing protein [Acidobacteriota bacterium]
MKRFLPIPFAVLALAVSSLAQQTIDQSAPHVADNASFGNQKSPKKEKPATTRTVTGQVTDETGQVLDGALVTLTDSKTNEKTTFFTKKDGRYKFEDLNFTNDYQVQARYKTWSSEPRKLSQYDHAPRPVRILAVNTETTGATSSAANAASAAPKQQ